MSEIRKVGVAVAVVLSACAQQAPLVNSNSAANLDADRWACQKEVAALSAQLNAGSPEPATTVNTSCHKYGDSTECESRAVKSKGFAGSFQQSYAASTLAQAMPNCMRAKGWR